jgi:putative intracellular protease/amidase
MRVGGLEYIEFHVYNVCVYFQSDAVGAMLRAQADAGRVVAAICAAPIALAAHRIAPATTVTSHPSVQKRLVDAGELRWDGDLKCTCVYVCVSIQFSRSFQATHIRSSAWWSPATW